MLIDSLPWIALLVAGATIAWLLRRRRTEPAPSFREQYLAGINYLLNEEADKALQLFLRLVEVDRDTIETHLALGSLYRRRGEVDRAIRIHENIVARAQLPPELRQQAMFALAEDYFRAGLFDRAEGLFQQLCEWPAWRTSALRFLLRIYEQQADWSQAIAAHHRLQALASPPHPTAIAHYYCELAEQARDRGEATAALALLRQVRSEQRNFARSALIRADIAWDAGDTALAARLCRRAADLHPQLLPIILQRYVRQEKTVVTVDESSLRRAIDLRPLVKSDSVSRAQFAAAGLAAGLEHDPFVLECLADYGRHDASLRELLPVIVGDVATLPIERREALADALARILRRGHRYRCVECGLSTTAHFWQCPGCRSWDTLAPVTNVELRPTAGNR